MAGTKSAPKGSKKAKSKSSNKGATLDVIFSGPLLFVPSIERGSIASLEVYAPQNGHPIGAVFLPGIRFSDGELDDPQCERWPPPESFSLLDPHSYLVELEQPGKSKPFPVTSIPPANHKVKSGRRLSHQWDISLGLRGKLSAWTSHRAVPILDGMFGGSDAPANGSASNMHRLTYQGVKAAHFHGISTPQREYLKTNIAKGGTLIVIGEIPYQSSLLHERHALDALANLAGLDLHFLSAQPLSNPGRIMHHVSPCLFSTVLVP